MDKIKGFFNADFMGEPAYRWMLFAIIATLFLFVWGRVISLLAEATETVAETLA